MTNTKLIEYGIFQYSSDYCIHVSPIVTQCLFIYKTKLMQELIKTNDFRTAVARQAYNGDFIITAEGYLVPCDNKLIRTVKFPAPKNKYNENMSTGKKGELAVVIVMYCLKNAMIAFEFDVGEVKDKDMQILGNDVIAVSDFKIQVKCDWRAGSKEDGGTGNLFVQTKECNPNRIH